MRRLSARRLAVPLAAAIGAAVLIVWVTVARPSPAAPSGRWPAGDIRIHDTSGWTRAIQLAIRQWNSAGLGVRFVPVAGRERADVVVAADEERVRRRCAETCAAFVTRIGYRAGAEPSELVLGERRHNERKLPSLKDVQLVVHELGHVLGLRHRDLDCKVMNPELARDCAPLLAAEGWLCGPLERDLAKAATLYDVRPNAVDPHCLT